MPFWTIPVARWCNTYSQPITSIMLLYPENIWCYMPDSTLAVATSCHWVKKIISYSNFHQTFQIGSYFFRNTYGLVKKIFRAKKRTSIGLIFSHFRSIFLIFGLFFSPTENFVIFICFTINFLNCFVYCPSGHFKINV